MCALRAALMDNFLCLRLRLCLCLCLCLCLSLLYTNVLPEQAETTLPCVREASARACISR
eukprot:COSAG03_NODE_136_length_11848_cov_31.778960_10_plen_60_part_00